MQDGLPMEKVHVELAAKPVRTAGGPRRGGMRRRWELRLQTGKGFREMTQVMAMDAAAEDQRADGGAALGVVSVATSAGAVLSCAACCVLPLALPAVALDGMAGGLAWMEAAHGWLTVAAVVLLAGAWGYVWRQSAATGRRAARATILLLGIATALTLVALAWSWIEPALIAALRG